MGLFHTLFGRKAAVASAAVTHTTTPAASAEEDPLICYRRYFDLAFGDVTGLEPAAIAGVFAMVAAAEGGFLNLGAYNSQAYERHFKGRDWSWLEYDRWDARFNELGRYPAGFESRPKRPTTEEAVAMLSVLELKELLKAKGAPFASKDKKQDLIALVIALPNLAAEGVIKSKIDETAEKNRQALYSILMRTISFRAKNLLDYNRAKRVGAKRFKHQFTYEGDKEFVDMALKEKAQIVPPYFPYDLTFLEPEFDL